MNVKVTLNVKVNVQTFFILEFSQKYIVPHFHIVSYSSFIIYLFDSSV